MRRYRELLTCPGFARLFLAQLVARSPVGIWSIGLLLYAQERTGSYGAAGLVTAMLTVGRAVGTPLMSRAVDRWGARRVLGVSALGSGLVVTAVVALDLSGSPQWVAILGYGLLTGLGGLLTPPVQPVVRAAFPRLVPERALTSAFSLDASAQEVIFVLGPLLAFAVATAAGPGWTIMLGVALLFAGTGWILTTAGLAQVPRTVERLRFGSVLARPVVLVGALVCLLLVAANSAVETAMVAAFGSGGVTGGVLLAVYSASSMVGGLAFARFTEGRWAQVGWLVTVAVGLGLAALSGQPWWLAVTLGVAGLGVAPVFAAVAWQVSTTVGGDQGATEAFGWVDTGAIAGASLGFAAAGAVIEGSAEPGGMLLAAVLAGLACVVAAVGTRALVVSGDGPTATDAPARRR